MANHVATAWTPRGYIVAVGSGAQTQMHIIVSSKPKPEVMAYGDTVQLTFPKGGPFGKATADVTVTGTVIGLAANIDANAPRS